MDTLEENWTLLSDLTHTTIEQADKKKEITHLEAFFTGTQTNQINIRDSEIQSQNKIYDFGVGFRVAIEGNRVGFGCTNKLTEKSVRSTLDAAYSIAKVNHKIPSFSLPKPGTLPKINGLFDPGIEETTVEEVIDVAKRAIIAAEESDERVIAKTGQINFETGWKGVLNNFGVDFEEKQTRAWIYLGGSGEHRGEVTGGCYDAQFCRDASLDPEVVGKTVGNRVIQMFNKQSIKSFQGTAIFSPEAVSYQLADVIDDTLNGENLISGSSVWSEKIGQTVCSEDLTITDNPTIDKGFSSRTFDDEGCTSQNTDLVNKGKLERFLHLATSATKLEVENTGNASRKGGFDLIRSIIGQGYRTKPKVNPSNLMILQGRKTKEELIAETDKGVLIESMAGFPQKGSGMLSLQLSRAFYIEKGVVQFPIKGGMVSGNAYGWLKHVSGIGNDSKQFQNSIVPSLRIENVNIIC